MNKNNPLPVIALLLFIALFSSLCEILGKIPRYSLGGNNQALHADVIITYMFCSASYAQLIINLLALVGIADSYKRSNKAFVIVFFMSGLIAGLGSLLWHAPDHLTAGCSGAIFGLVGYLMVSDLSDRNGRLTTILVYVVFWLICAFVSWVLSTKMHVDIDHINHLCGAIGGIILGIISLTFARIFQTTAR